MNKATAAAVGGGVGALALGVLGAVLGGKRKRGMGAGLGALGGAVLGAGAGYYAGSDETTDVNPKVSQTTQQVGYDPNAGGATVGGSSGGSGATGGSTGGSASGSGATVDVNNQDPSANSGNDPWDIMSGVALRRNYERKNVVRNIRDYRLAMSFRGPITAAKPKGYEGWKAYTIADKPGANILTAERPWTRGGTQPYSRFMECQYPDLATGGGTIIAAGERFLVQIAPDNAIAMLAASLAPGQATVGDALLYGAKVAFVSETGQPLPFPVLDPTDPDPTPDPHDPKGTPPPVVWKPRVPPKQVKKLPPTKQLPAPSKKGPTRPQLIAAGYVPRSRAPWLVLGLSTVVGGVLTWRFTR